jgi:hypothetical protein
VNADLSSTTGRQARSVAWMPAPGASIDSVWPVPSPASVSPSGPVTSTVLRAAACSAKVRRASSSMLTHASAETGASSRCRLFIATFRYS